MPRRVGVTSVQHMNPEWADVTVYDELLEEGKLTTRIYAAPLITQVDDQLKIGIRRAFGGPVSADWRGEGLCGWLARIGYRIFL